MAKLIELQETKTYATKANAVAAVEKLYAHSDLRYMILKTEIGRYFPVFLGETALQQMVHFKFHVVG